MTYTVTQGEKDAISRATRDRAGSFAVFLDGEDVCVRDARALRPAGAKLVCIVQFWLERPDGVVEVPIRRPGALTEWVEVTT